MTMPNFLIIGAAKAGTTSLHYYLAQHPEIYMSPIKEPRFFALEGEKLEFQNPDQGINKISVTDLETYVDLFSGVTSEIAIGEASPLYLYSTKAVERIKHYIPDVKIVVVLRNPADRAHSCYTHLVREGYETLSFSEALQEEEKRIQNNWAHLWHYRQGGYYYEQLKRYFDAFEPKQIKVYLFEELQTDSVSMSQDVFSFLGIDSSFVPYITRKNVSGIPKNRLLHTLFSRNNVIRSVLSPLFSEGLRKRISQKVKDINLGKKLTMSTEDRMQLTEDFHEDIDKLQGLIKKDLSIWLK